MASAPMLGTPRVTGRFPSTNSGPGGWQCPCCTPPYRRKSKDSTAKNRRAIKRAERRFWKSELFDDL